ncbi:MAG: hypothetical protein Q9170_004860 [Blastenia crenularia]
MLLSQTRWLGLHELWAIYPLSTKALNVLQQPVPASSFPFEKLPAELRLNVLRYAMPRHGLRPLPLPSDFDNEQLACVEYVAALRQEQSTPLNLLRVGRQIASEARTIIDEEVVLRIDVGPTGILLLGTEIGNLHRLRSRTFPEVFTLLKSMRNYEIFVSIHQDQFREVAADPRGRFSACCFKTKEWLRVLCDTISTNEQIETLVVNIPGVCTLRQLIVLNDDPRPEISSMITPLARLRVKKSITFTPHYDSFHKELRNRCSRFGDPECYKMAETTWKRLKYKDKAQTEKPLGAICRSPLTADLFDELQETLEVKIYFPYFETRARRLLQHLEHEELIRQDFCKRSAGRGRCNQLKQDVGHPIKIDEDMDLQQREGRL